MNTLNIRLCRLDDVPCIIEIRKRTFLHFAPSVYSPKEVKTLLEDLKPSELEEHHKIVGCGGWLGESVRHMYVSPEEMKKGIGSSLLRALEEDYQHRTNNSILQAGVILYAKPFYEKNGYEFLKLDTDWDGSTFNRKKLL